MLNAYLGLDKVVKSYLLSIDMETNRIPPLSLMVLKFINNNSG